MCDSNFFNNKNLKGGVRMNEYIRMYLKHFTHFKICTFINWNWLYEDDVLFAGEECKTFF